MQSHWIFSFAEPLDEATQYALAKRMEEALKGWQAHGRPIESRFALRERRFLLVEATSDTSGCSRDWLQNVVTYAAEGLGIALAGSEQVFFKRPDGEVVSHDFRAVEQAVAQGHLAPDTPMFDHTVVHQNTFMGWEKPLKASWLAARAGLTS